MSAAKSIVSPDLSVWLCLGYSIVIGSVTFAIGLKNKSKALPRKRQKRDRKITRGKD